jgi:hypothetical protein
MNDKQLKHLAEQHFFLGKRLTLEEAVLLKNSKYKNVVKAKDKFTSLYEEATEDTLPPPRKRDRSYRHHFCTNVNKRDIADLVDEIEIEFNLDIDNISPDKYKQVNLDNMKQFISSYAGKNIMDDNTQCVIDEITRPESTIVDILHTLYTYSY